MSSLTEFSPGLPASKKPPDVVELSSPIEDQSDDSFELLLQKMRMAHYRKVRQLSLEVESLRGQLAERRDKAPTQLDVPPEKLATEGAPELGGSPPSTPKSTGSHGLGTQEDSARRVPPPESPAARLSRISSSESNLTASGGIQRGLHNSHTRQQMLKEWMRQKDPLYRLVHHPAFEVVCAIVLLSFGLFLAFEAQFFGFDVAVATGHASAWKRSEVLWPDGKDVLNVGQWVFGIVFLVEMLLKMAGLRLDFGRDPWNWLDLAVNLLWLYSLLEITNIPVNPQMVRISRLSRLLRLIRLVKFLKGQKFDSLYLMTTAVKGSVSILAWTLLLLLLIHLMLSIFLSQILRETYFNIEDPSTAAGQVKVYEYFGTFFRSLLTMFEITLANWPPACRILIENVSEWFILYAVLHKMVLGFAVIGVVNGVFIQETFKVATLDDAVMVRQTMRKQAAHKSKMMSLFEEADADGNGFIDEEEWKRVCEDEWVKVWLASQELNVTDAQSLFKLIDDGDGKLGAEELVKGASRLRGPGATLEMLRKLNRVVEKMDGCFPEGSAKTSPHQVEQWCN